MLQTKFPGTCLLWFLLSLSPLSRAQDTASFKTKRIQEFYSANKGNDLPSKSTGTVSDGKLENGKLVPFYGANFEYFDTTSYFERRAYLNDKVLETVLATYTEFEILVPGRRFYIMECSNEKGGKMFPHHTHQNGLSIDFMSPLLKDGKPHTDLDTLGIDHYWMKFNESGIYSEDATVSLDFNLIAHHILILESTARKYGLKIAKVIFKLELKDELFATEFGKKLAATSIYFAKSLPDQINELHDDHYHVDFEFIQ